MDGWTELRSADGHQFAAWTAFPEGKPKGGIVVIQEIFVVTGHIRSVAEGYAAEGYAVIAPALFDRVRAGVELEYSDIPGGRAIVEQIEPVKAKADIAAAANWARSYGKVAVIGFCWGGTLAHLVAASGVVDAAVAYYGGMIAKFLDHKPVVPAMYHFGGEDVYIPKDDVAAIAQAFGPEIVYIYDEAGHGFNCTERADYRAQAAALARTRTLDFLGAHIAGAA